MSDARAAGPETRPSPPVTATRPRLPNPEHIPDLASRADVVAKTVMAEQVSNDVVKEAQSVGRPAPIDDTASTTNTLAANGELPSGTTTATEKSSESSSVTAAATDASAAPPVIAPAVTKTGVDGVTAGIPTVDDRAPMLNGDRAHSPTDSQQALGEASGGSDTDISRPSSVDQSKRDPSHVRNISVKKPSAFKSVSVTKNFLAKSITPTPVTRPGEKPTPAAATTSPAMLAPKPRLVAKLGTGNAPRTLGKVNGVGGGPDGSKVWNKNQPVPPPPPKQFTDEELKQQYGIHLATRLQADEAGKEAKWADIDDDEDDWAPETVQWMDGTKSTVVAAENEAPPVEEPKTIVQPAPRTESPKPAPAPTTMNAPKPSVTGGTKTILKPGSHALGTTKSSLVLKGQPEKPTLVAKPLTSEKKSPWATLPPVEKVSPVQINPPQQAPPPQRGSQRDIYGYDTMPQLPAKEIAPDDFNRAWRDDRGTNRELFNSHNGRYEPAPEARRPSIRENSYRQQPAVLQRPNQNGPAEPSAAFQTSRASADAPAWGRRRNSSNVSGGIPRRLSIERRGPELTVERRLSHSINGVDSSDADSSRQASLVQQASPNIATVQPASPFESVASSGNHEAPAPVQPPAQPPVAAPPAEDAVEVQKRLMADKIERARLKKQKEQEEEKKAEAERKERIAKKLAALAPPPTEAKAKPKDQSPSQSAQQSPRKSRAVPASVQSPPKPPVPTADGEVAQYGLMKVHHAQPVKKTLESAPMSQSSKTTEPSPKTSSVEGTAKALEPASLSPPPKQSAQPLDQRARAEDESTKSADQSKSPAQQTEGTIPAGPKAQAPQPAWSSASAPHPRPWTSQVWGAPGSKNRALGNGTFNSTYGRGQPQSAPQQQQQLPAQQPSAVTTSADSLHLTQSTTNPQPAQPLNSQQMYSGGSSLPSQAAAMPKPGPIAPVIDKGWGNFRAAIRADDLAQAAKNRQEFERLGGELFRPELRETYKDPRGQTTTTLHSKIAPTGLSDGAIKKEEGPKPAHDGSQSQQNIAQAAPLAQASGPRASRFFPRPAETTPQPTPASSAKLDSPPPPPETESHPAFSSSTVLPQVRLPKPSPVVRLPPSVQGFTAQTEPSVVLPPAHSVMGARPLAKNPEWQARFNKLLEKPGPPAGPHTPRPTVAAPASAASKTGALAVAALSKAPFDDRAAGNATVSLPVATRKLTPDQHSSEFITRKGTEVLFEDREFGSVPTIKLPKTSHLRSTEDVVRVCNDDPRNIFKRFENPFTVRRLEAFDLERFTDKYDIIIRTSTMSSAITKSVPKRKRRGGKGEAQHKQKRINGPSSPTGGTKDRPRKPNQSNSGDYQGGSSRLPATATWGNTNHSTPPHQQTTWARRAAAIV